MNKKLEEYSREELIEEIKSLKRRKKFGLVWEDKKEDIVEKCKNEIPVLKEVPELAINEKPGEPTNLIIEGDNFASLQVLSYTHHGKIDVIYIDPPYNTGNKDFIYNDSYVDSEDSFRHSKWLSFMDRRLRLARELLSDDGVIFISISDVELSSLRLMCDSIFCEENFIANLVWTNNEGGGSSDAKFFKIKHEYILCYCKNINKCRNIKNVEIEDIDRYKLSDEYENIRGKHQLVKLSSASIQYSQSLDYPITCPDGTEVYPADNSNKDRSSWRWGKKKLQWGIENGFVVFKKDKNNVWQVYTKQYVNCDKDGNIVMRTKKPMGIIDRFSSTQGSNELYRLLNTKTFSYPKPTELLKYLICRFSKSNSVILDFFAGSGTTGQAVLELNIEDGGARRFILCTHGKENEKSEVNISRDITFPRIKTVVTGIRPDGSKYFDGIPANVRYFITDFIEKGVTNDVTRAKLFEKSDEMIQVRENAFEFVDKNDNYTFYKNNEKFVAIIKDPFSFGPIWYELEEKNVEKLPVKLYVFSYSNYTFEDEIPDTDLKYEICAIPNSIMEVYRKISDKKEER